MKMPLFSLAALVAGCLAAHAETTPLTPLPAEETETEIACELTQPPRRFDVPVFDTQKEADATKGTYHYKLWVPKGYGAAPFKQWPCMFIMSPGGNASMAGMENFLKNNGFIVVMLEEAKNGDWPPIIGNFLAAHDDVTKRLRVGAKYATGYSGGARGSSIFVQLRPGFRGLILQGAGPAYDARSNFFVAGIKRQGQLRIAMTMGNADQNKGEVARMKGLFNGQKLAVFEFDGGHTWAPSDVFEKAMAWLDKK
jgi:hypothetical protein